MFNIDAGCILRAGCSQLWRAASVTFMGGSLAAGRAGVVDGRRSVPSNFSGTHGPTTCGRSLASLSPKLCALINKTF